MAVGFLSKVSPCPGSQERNPMHPYLTLGLCRSVPGGIISFLLVAIYLPSSEASSKVSLRTSLRNKFRRSTLVRIDFLGMFLSLASSILLVFALEEGGTRYSWNNPAVLATLVISLVLGIVFVVWEIYIDKPSVVQEPVFPPSLLKNRLLAAMLA